MAEAGAREDRKRPLREGEPELGIRQPLNDDFDLASAFPAEIFLNLILTLLERKS